MSPMKSFLSFFIFVFLVFCAVGCSGQRAMSLENPVPMESARITMKNGKIYEGLLIKTENENLRYIDNVTHKPEQLKISGIMKINPVGTLYDLEGYPITEEQVAQHKSIKKMMAYGAGGTIICSGIVFVATSLWAKGADKSLPEPGVYYSMGAAGIAGGVLFGLLGNKQDRTDSIAEIRNERYIKTEKRLKTELEQKKKEVEKQRKELEEMNKKKKQ